MKASYGKRDWKCEDSLLIIGRMGTPPWWLQGDTMPYMFDVKLDMIRKVRLLTGRHRNKNVLVFTIFSTVVFRDSVSLMSFISTLNNLELLSAGISNVFLNTKCWERAHVRCGAELLGQEYITKPAIISWVLYGLKTSGASCRQYLASEIRYLGFINTKGALDIYRKTS